MGTERHLVFYGRRGNDGSRHVVCVAEVLSQTLSVLGGRKIYCSLIDKFVIEFF